MQQVYHYDENGASSGSSPAKLDPRESTEEAPVYLLPRNSTFTAPPAANEGQVAVFDGTDWALDEDHRGETAYDGAQSVTVRRTGSLGALGLSDAPPADPEPTAKQQRDGQLAALAHDFGDGRVIQTRPRDEQNLRNAIELMQSETIEAIGWVMQDDTKHPVTRDELLAALRAGQLAALAIWADYEPG